jgi:hypothetical protein
MPQPCPDHRTRGRTPVTTSAPWIGNHVTVKQVALLVQVPDPWSPKRGDGPSSGIEQSQARIAQVQCTGRPTFCRKQRQGHAAAVGTESGLASAGRGNELDLLRPNYRAYPRARKGAKAHRKDAEPAQGEATQASLPPLELRNPDHDPGHVRACHTDFLHNEACSTPWKAVGRIPSDRETWRVAAAACSTIPLHPALPLCVCPSDLSRLHCIRRRNRPANTSLHSSPG